MAEFREDEVKQVVRAAKLIERNLDISMRADDRINMAALVGVNDLVFQTVDDGRMLIIEHLSGENRISACTRIRLGYWNGFAFDWLRTVVAPLVTETVEHNSPLRLREGMWPVVRFEGCVAGDDIFASLNGYYIQTR